MHYQTNTCRSYRPKPNISFTLPESCVVFCCCCCCHDSLTDLIVVRVPDHPAAVLLRVDGFSLAALHGVDQCHAPAKRARTTTKNNATRVVRGAGSTVLKKCRPFCERGTPSKLKPPFRTACNPFIGDKLLTIRVCSYFKWLKKRLTRIGLDSLLGYKLLEVRVR